MNISIIGLGLIGGSIAKALKKHTNNYITAFDINENVLKKAKSVNLIDDFCDKTLLSNSDVVYLCVYPKHAIEFVKKNAHFFKPGCIVTDTSGVKSFICEKLTNIAKNNNFTFIGSHPMAGKEKNGFEASDENLFKGASYIITPIDKEFYGDSINVLENLALKMGFNKISKTTPQEHDEIISFTSQIPHILACSYVLSPQCPKHTGFSAGSYKDVSRVANINENLWAELFLENRESLINEINILVKNINKFKNSIEKNDFEALKHLLRQSRKIKESLGE